MMISNMFRANEIIVLLGAGSSVDAGIPDSNEMIKRIETAIANDSLPWAEFRELYRYIRSAVYYADGLDGIIGKDVVFNIERLVNVLDELSQKERHTLYPFVGAWNAKLLEVAGKGYNNINAFRQSILEILRNDWLAPREYNKADYYRGLLRFQEEYQHTLRVFSLNYDLCIENTCDKNNVQRGFADRAWDWRMYEETSDDSIAIKLYKMHGSVDWYWADDGEIMYADSPCAIGDKFALIFGTQYKYKFRYFDPFLYLAYEFRRRSLEDARVLVCIGYGFNDPHINVILEQSLRKKRERKLVAVIGPVASSEKEKQTKRIIEALSACTSQITVEAVGAKEFLEKTLTIAYLEKMLPAEEMLFEEVAE